MALRFRDGSIQAWLCFAACLSLTLLLYGTALSGWWCCDDPQILKHALNYAPWEYFGVPEAWRKLIPYSLTPWLSFANDLDNSLFGTHPAGYYAHNLLMITLCAQMTYLVARQWTGRWYAFGGAVLLLVGSPVMTASYQLMVRHYIEGLFFYLVALWLFIRGLRGENRRLPVWLAGIPFAIAVTAKEIYLPLGIVPFLLPLGSFRQRLRTAWPLLLVMILYIPWRRYMLGDIVGGYTPAGELGRSDLLAALAQFAKAPELLLSWPWLGAGGLLALAGLLVHMMRNRWSLLPLILLPVLLLAPLVPLARQPGIGSGSDRYFIAVWAALALGSAVVSGLVATGRGIGIRLFSSTVMLTLIVSAWCHARQIQAAMIPSLKEQAAQGKALVTAAERDTIYLTPAVAPWYISGIIDLQRELGRNIQTPPCTASDEIDLSEGFSAGRRIVRYDQATQKMVDITGQIPHLLEEWRKKVRLAPLTVTMEFDADKKIMQWQLGPNEKGTYTMLPDYGRQPLPAKGILRMENPPLGVSCRFRYDSPDGWVAYTPQLRFVAERAGRYRLHWQQVTPAGGALR